MYYYRFLITLLPHLSISTIAWNSFSTSLVRSKWFLYVIFIFGIINSQHRIFARRDESSSWVLDNETSKSTNVTLDITSYRKASPLHYFDLCLLLSAFQHSLSRINSRILTVLIAVILFEESPTESSPQILNNRIPSDLWFTIRNLPLRVSPSRGDVQQISMIIKPSLAQTTQAQTT